MSSPDKGSPSTSLSQRLLSGTAFKSDDPGYEDVEEAPLGGTQKPMFDLVLVHPAEGMNPKTLGAGVCAALCGEISQGEPESAETLKRRQALHARMRCLGLALSFDLSRDADEVLIKIKASEEMLENMAERLAIEKKLISGGYADFTRKARTKFVVERDGQGQKSTKRFAPESEKDFC